MHRSKVLDGKRVERVSKYSSIKQARKDIRSYVEEESQILQQFDEAIRVIFMRGQNHL